MKKPPDRPKRSCRACPSSRGLGPAQGENASSQTLRQRKRLPRRGWRTRRVSGSGAVGTDWPEFHSYAAAWVTQVPPHEGGQRREPSHHAGVLLQRRREGGGHAVVARGGERAAIVQQVGDSRVRLAGPRRIGRERAPRRSKAWASSWKRSRLATPATRSGTCMTCHEVQGQGGVAMS